MTAGGAKFWGDLVRQLREEHGLSQHKLSLKSGVARSTLRRIEQGIPVVLGIDAIESLLGFLGYELDAIKRDDADEVVRANFADIRPRKSNKKPDDSEINCKPAG